MSHKTYTARLKTNSSFGVAWRQSFIAGHKCLSLCCDSTELSRQAAKPTLCGSNSATVIQPLAGRLATAMQLGQLDFPAKQKNVLSKTQQGSKVQHRPWCFCIQVPVLSPESTMQICNRQQENRLPRHHKAEHGCRRAADLLAAAKVVPRRGFQQQSGWGCSHQPWPFWGYCKSWGAPQLSWRYPGGWLQLPLHL